MVEKTEVLVLWLCREPDPISRYWLKLNGAPEQGPARVVTTPVLRCGIARHAGFSAF